MLEEDDRELRRLGAGLGRVCGVVLADSDDGSRSRDRSADALTGHFHSREGFLLHCDAKAGRRGVRGGATARNVDVIASDRERLSTVASHG